MLSLIVGASACAVFIRAVWDRWLAVGLSCAPDGRLPLVRCDLVLRLVLDVTLAARGLSGAPGGPSAAPANDRQGDQDGPRPSVSEIANNGATPSCRPMGAAYPFAVCAAKLRFAPRRVAQPAVVLGWAPSARGGRMGHKPCFIPRETRISDWSRRPPWGPTRPPTSIWRARSWPAHRGRPSWPGIA